MLRRLTVGRPTLNCDAQAADRYRLVLTRLGDRHVLHAIDRAAAGPDYKAADLTVSLDVERFGGIERAMLVGNEIPLKITQSDGRATLVVRPDPVANIVLE